MPGGTRAWGGGSICPRCIPGGGGGGCCWGGAGGGGAAAAVGGVLRFRLVRVVVVVVAVGGGDCCWPDDWPGWDVGVLAGGMGSSRRRITGRVLVLAVSLSDGCCWAV